VTALDLDAAALGWAKAKALSLCVPKPRVPRAHQRNRRKLRAPLVGTAHDSSTSRLHPPYKLQAKTSRHLTR